MAIVKVTFECGCGVKVRTVEEAIVHADDLKHTVNARGVVQPSERKVRKASSPVSTSPRPRRRSTAAAPEVVQAEDKADFGRLRARLQKR